jgi:4-carboxymuconolactone decarboxylase
MATSTKRQAGVAKFTEVMGFAPPTTEGDPFLQTTFDHLFAELWARPGLSRRDRRLITLTVLMGFGSEMALNLHFGAAMRSGDLSDQEIDELILHAAHYAGWPTAAVASQVVARLRAERQAKG